MDIVNFFPKHFLCVLSMIGLGSGAFAQGESFEELLPKAMGGDVYSQERLGFLYFDGTVIDRDYAKALQWYERAGKQGSAYAQYSSGQFYLIGWGVEKDLTQAYDFFVQAEAQDYAKAQIAIGEMHLYREIEFDAEECFNMFSKAASQGDDKAEVWMSYIFYEDSCLPEMTHDERHEQTVAWSRLAVADGDLESMRRLGYTLALHPDLAQNPNEGIAYLEQSEAAGIKKATFNLAAVYELGISVDIDLDKAASYYTKLAPNHEEAAQWLVDNGYDTMGQKILTLSDYKAMDADTRLEKMKEIGASEDPDIALIVAVLEHSAMEIHHPSIEFLFDVMFRHYDEIAEGKADYWVAFAAENGVLRGKFIAAAFISEQINPSQSDVEKAVGYLREVHAAGIAGYQRDLEYIVKVLGQDLSSWERSDSWYIDRAQEGDQHARFVAAQLLHSDTATPDEKLTATCWISKIITSTTSTLEVSLSNVATALSDHKTTFLLPETPVSQQACAVDPALDSAALIANAKDTLDRETSTPVLYGRLDHTLAWLRLAGIHGSEDAQVMFGLLMDDDEISPSWIENAALSGHAGAQFQWSMNLLNNLSGSDADRAESERAALMFSTLAAAQNFAPSYRILQKLYETGTAVPEADEAVAANWAERADAAGVLSGEAFWDIALEPRSFRSGDASNLFSKTFGLMK